MKKYIKTLSTALLCLTFIVISSNVFAQTTSLNYKIKGKSTYAVDIAFADINGNISLQPTEYFNYSDVYFVLSPTPNSPKDFFKDDNVEKILSKISISQNANNINQSALPKSIINENKKIGKVVIAFPKTAFENYNSFSFIVNEFSSENVNLKEEFFQSFVPQNAIYGQGLSLVKDADYIGAYNNFMKIVEDSKETPEIKSFSFYGPLVITNIPQTIHLFILSELENFNLSNDAFHENKTMAALNTCKAIVESVSKKLEVFNSYLILEGVDVSISEDKITSFLNTLSSQNNENVAAFEQEKMLFFKQGNYQNYKFSLFIDLISKMLLNKNSFSAIDNIEPIEIGLLKSFPESKNELIGDWFEQFKIYIDLINSNIEYSGFIFKEEVMDNLKKISSSQKQPYFEIISAFNSLNEDTESFREYLQTALRKSSDETIIENIEFWLLSFRLTDEGINSAYITELNEGIKLIKNGQYERADDLFVSLMRISNQYAPVWYYTGLIKHGMGESYSAERFFKKSLEIYPEYMAPRNFILKIFENEESYSQLLGNTNTALETMNAWTFRFKRASAYYHLEKYEEAITEINNECLKLNSWEIKQYFLLGDAYLALDNFEEAKKAYEKTLDINPFSTDSKSFDDRMKVVYKKMEEAEKVKASEEVVVEEDTEKTEEI